MEQKPASIQGISIGSRMTLQLLFGINDNALGLLAVDVESFHMASHRHHSGIVK